MRGVCQMDSKKPEEKATIKKEKKQPAKATRGRVIKNKTFKRRTDKREVKANG
jgi:hypothetical protein